MIAALAMTSCMRTALQVSHPCLHRTLHHGYLQLQGAPLCAGMRLQQQSRLKAQASLPDQEILSMASSLRLQAQMK